MSKKSLPETDLSVIFSTLNHRGHQLPGLWKYMLPEDFEWLNLPEERLANCHDCHKVLTDKYRKDCRCCTYFPQLPNFMIGLALKDKTSRPWIKKMIASGYALPEGTQITPSALKLAVDEYANDQFGKTEHIICPLIDPSSGHCMIYPYRNSVCATFYCENDHGDIGYKFWEDVQMFVGQVEIALYQFAMEKAGYSPALYIQRMDELAETLHTVEDISDASWSKETLTHLWGEWHGRELEFFERCAEEIVNHRDNLYDIACNQKALVALKFDRAVENQIPMEKRGEIQQLPNEPGEPVPVSDLWYKLQVAGRNLWKVPFNEGQWIINPNGTWSNNPLDDILSKLYADKKHVFEFKKNNSDKTQRLFFDHTEYTALSLFDTAQIIGEKLFETPQINALTDARVFLAEVLRKEVLIESDL